jgi:hypothetical protein
MQIGEKEKTTTYPKRTVTRPAPAEPIPAEGWPVKKDADTPIAAPGWPQPATVEPQRTR